MTVDGAAKRKHPGPADSGRQEPSKPGSRMQLKGGLLAIAEIGGNGKGRRKEMVRGHDIQESRDGESEGDDEGAEGGSYGDDYDDSRSQKRRMILFEKRLKEIKNQKKSSFENNAIKFKKKVKLQEETLLNSLQEQRAKIKTDASNFSETLAALFHDAFNSPFSGPLPRFAISSPSLIQDHQLHAPQVTIAALSTSLLTSAQSLQATLTKIIDNELTIGEGWEQDGDLSINIVRQAQQTSLVKLTEMISKDEDEDIPGVKEEVGEVVWKHATKRSTKGISRLLKHLPVPTTDEVK